MTMHPQGPYAPQQLSAEDARILQAVLGTCPDCGSVTSVDGQCLIDYPLVLGGRAKKIAAAVLCGGCEFCAEIPTVVMEVVKARARR